MCALTLTIALNGCAMPATPLSVPDAECPLVLLVRRGGLGTESHSGTIAAVWASGRIVRTESERRPWERHVLGWLKPEELRSLQDLVSLPATWAESEGEVALDMPAELLKLRKDGAQREWAETPGVTSTPIVSKFRRMLLGVAVERPQRLREPFQSASSCQ
jgi:hypothetical protein